MASTCLAIVQFWAGALGLFLSYTPIQELLTNFFVNEAENDYVQLLAEIGTRGFGTMVWFSTVMYRPVSTQE